DDKTVAEIPASAGNSLKAIIDKYASLRATLRDLAPKARTGKGPGIHDLKSLDTLAPIPDPLSVLNAAVNYVEHGNEMARAGGGGAQPAAAAPASIPGIWDRKPGDTRQNPYLFPKLQAAITGDGDPIRLPPGRDRVDWECELAVVIGRSADHVRPDQANDYVFGYTLMNDVSDRGGRADGRHRSDGLIRKSHPTVPPPGPPVGP